MDVGRWIIDYVASVVGREADDLDLHEPMEVYDFDSIDAVEMTFAFERTFGREVDPHLILQGDQTVAGLIAELSRPPGACAGS
ncbi:acyl carrier protein [Methylorubrum salsuginis]|uniref:Phosphopantetheine attachment site n=1 Tax=Methylorubrum salsuginis TaxID=414703 RepID=A0A1I4C4P5_9HYPH|nr:acyl carrier protein [Methylorubrum salsuginis]SFK76052.1 Phosphopantetheine attachment site [Methylorubrum salsuginis]